jgi:amino acid transporter
MRLLDLLIGSRIATNEEGEQRVGPLKGIPMLGLDALGSSAYGPEAALTVLIPLGAAAASYALPVIGLITALLIVVYVSYRQTIAAYPNGGGSFTVANENLGAKAGVLAAAALMLDYILNAAVGISAGVGALVSAIPALNPYMLPLCLVILAIITVVNLRGVRESGGAFLIPTYLFLASMFGVLLFGLAKTLLAAGHPHPVVPLPTTTKAAGAVNLWLLIRAFASGCTAMTGVEAVSNGVTAFEEPTVKNAQRTLGILVAALIGLLVLIAFLTRAYGIGATPPGGRDYQSVVSQLVGAIAGRGAIYYIAIGSTLAVLCLSANTSFAGFPRLARLLADHDYLPHAFANRGRRLVYSIGILVLTVLSGILLVVFSGVTDRLIPLFAVGALLAFTLSQAGMVMHWKKTGGAGPKMALNLLGAVCTGLALAVVLAAKFTEGAWITVLIVGALVWLFSGIKRHYRHVEEAVTCKEPIEAVAKVAPVVIVPVLRWNMVTAKAVRFALSISDEVLALHVAIDDEEEAKIKDEWRRFVDEPLARAGQAVPQITVVRSPYRRLFGPLLTFVARTRHRCPGQTIAVVVSELVEERWYQYFLHNQRSTMLKAALLFHGGGRVVVVNVPWYLKEPNGESQEIAPRSGSPKPS